MGWPAGESRLHELWLFGVGGADFFEGGESRGGGGIRVDEKDVGALDVLKDAHGCVPDVVLHHQTIRDPRLDVPTGVLENASGSERTFVRIVHEVLANRRQVLFVQVLFSLKLVLPVREAAALAVGLVFAGKPFKPKSAKLGLDLSFPALWLAYLCFPGLSWFLRGLIQVLRRARVKR